LYKLKNNSSGAIKQNTKLLLNGFYGKFGTNPERRSKMIVGLDDNGVVKSSNSH